VERYLPRGGFVVARRLILGYILATSGGRRRLDSLNPKTYTLDPTHMSQDQLIKLACDTCKRTNYWSRKNKKLVTKKIELKKYCRWCRKSTKHKEAKK
jgi:large subunit ribosomal protein L33